MKTDLSTAIETLNNGHYTCVLCKGDKICTSTERGVKPLIGFLDGGDFRGFSAADKVVGKAAAFVYVLLGVKAVYARVMSEGAVGVFAENDVVYQCDTSAKKIINRTGTGICPMEEAVGELSDPNEALKAIQTKLKQLSDNRK